MVDNNPDDLNSRLKKLSKREIQVLELRCKGMKYVDIAEALHIAVSTVKEDMSRIYIKLGLDLLDPSVRVKVLYDTVCPFFKSQKAAQEEADSKPKEVIDGEVMPEEKEKTVPKNILDMVENDEQRGPAPLVAPSNPPSRRPIWPVVLILGVVLCICLGAGVAYLFLRPGNGLNLFSPQPTSNISSQAPVDTETAIAAPLPAPIDTATVMPAPINTSVPTLTEVATTVPPPTNIPFVPPADGILFQDNFDNGLKSDWIQYSGQWIVSDGKLTEVYQSSSTDAYSWIGVENPSWKNYIVDLTIQIYQPLTESDEIALAVRDNNVGSKYIGFEIDFWPHIYLSLISQGYASSAPIAGNNKDFTFPLKTDAQTEIKVENNNYTLTVNGTTLQTISIPGYDSGGFRLGLYCRGYPRCPTFDNFKVTYLP